MKSRRNFLQRTTLTAGAAALCNSPATAQTEKSVSPANPSSKVPGYSYHLPTFKTGSRLLFQGDSITDMKWGRNEKDRNHYLGHSYVFLIASRLGVEIPGAQLDFYNRGISGNTVGDLRNRWQTDAIDMKPDLLSILIGTNDAGRNPDGIDLVKWEEDYRFILESSRAANPDLRIVLLDPFVVSSGNLAKPEIYKKRRSQIDQLIPIVEKLAKEFDAAHIKTQEIFDTASQAVSPEHWLWDGIHPLPQGHELIARNWIGKVSVKWPSV